MTWSAWINRGAPAGGTTASPATISRHQGACNVYVRGNDDKLWQLPYYGGRWHDWSRHADGVLASAPAAGSMSPRQEHVFVRGTDGHVYEKYWFAAEPGPVVGPLRVGWSGWVDVGAPAGGCAGAPATVSRRKDVCNVYVRGNDNKLWQRAYYDGRWHDWSQHADGVLASDPAVGSMGPDHEQVFVRGTDGNVYQKYWTASTGWSGWVSIGAPAGGCAGAPATISRRTDVCNVYVRGNDNKLWQRAYYDGRWHDWSQHADGVLASDPAVGSMGRDHEQVFVRGTDGSVYEKYWEPGTQGQAGHPLMNSNFDIDGFLADPDAWEGAKVLVEDSPEGTFRLYGPVWTLSLDNEQTRRLTSTLLAGAPGILSAAGVAAPIIAASLAAAVGYINLVNAVGGQRGVDITGVLFKEGLIVTPRLDGGPLEAFVDAARKGFAASTLAQWVISAATASPVFANTMGLMGVAGVLSLMSAGTPLGWALAGAAGLLIDLLGDEPDPNQHGAVTADRGAVGTWETFTMTQLRGDRVTLLSHLGLLSAQGGGGGAVYANRPTPGDWETWQFTDNRDGTISLGSINGHFLVAENGGGSVCNADRRSIGPWEKFHLITLTGSRVALRTAATGQYVSVQP